METAIAVLVVVVVLAFLVWPLLRPPLMPLRQTPQALLL